MPLLEGAQILLDEVPHERLAGEDGLVSGDLLEELAVLLLELLALQAGQALEAHLEDGRGLAVREGEALDELAVRRLHVGRLLDELDDLVDVGQRDAQAFDDVGASLRSVQKELRAASDHLDAVLKYSSICLRLSVRGRLSTRAIMIMEMEDWRGVCW